MKIYILLFVMMAFNASMIAQPSAISILPYTQDFEGSTFLPTDWQAFGSNTNAAWEHNTSVGAYGNSSGSAFFDNFSGNLAGNYYGMRAVTLDLTNAVKPTMKFDVAYAKRDASTSDILGIWYSFNGTTGWQNLQNFQGNALSTAADQNSFFTPTATDWDSITIDLTQFSGDPLVRFAFENNCQNGNVIYIDNVRFYDSQFVGLNEVEEKTNEVIVSPNPISNGLIHVRSKDDFIASFKLLDNTGREVLLRNLGQVEEFKIDLNNYKSGIYILQLYFQEGVIQTERILLN